MRRLLQCGLSLLLLAAVLVPVVEFFDQWDPPGLADDTEMGVFGLILLLALILLVCTIVASLAYRLTLALFASIQQNDDPRSANSLCPASPLPLILPPLRI